MAPFNHIHHPARKTTHTHKPNMCCLCVADSSSVYECWKYKRYSGVGCWLLLGHITPSLPRHAVFFCDTHVLLVRTQTTVLTHDGGISFKHGDLILCLSLSNKETTGKLILCYKTLPYCSERQ